MNPSGLRYAETHEWAGREGDIVTVGITRHAVEELGDLVYIELPEVGKAAVKGKAFGEIESVKAVSELMSPVDGEIVEVNSSLTDELEIVSADPYGSGWMVKIKASDLSQLNDLMTAEQYQRKVEAEQKEKEK